MVHFEDFIKTFHESNFLHHAILVEGEARAGLMAVRELIEQELGITIHGNPDAFVVEGESFGIDEARELRRRQEMHALGDDRKIFVVAAQAVTTEAQNALLKTLEEPTEGTHFFFIVPYAETLLPTLRSRMVRVTPMRSAGTDDSHTTLAKAFLRAETPAERMRLVKPLLDTKDKAQAAAFIDRLIGQLRLESSFSSVLTAHTLTDLLRVRGYLAGRSPSVKILLEHVSGMLPVL